jgi:hypothetical protein
MVIVVVMIIASTTRTDKDLLNPYSASRERLLWVTAASLSMPPVLVEGR